MDVPTLAAVGNMLSVARRLTRAQAGTVYRREANGLRYLIVHNDPLAGTVGCEPAIELLRRSVVPWRQRSIAMYVAVARTTVNVPDAYRISSTCPYAFNPRVDAMTRFRTISMLALPLMAPISGVLQLINATSNSGDVVPFSRAAEILVEEVAVQAATAAWKLSTGMNA
jgi:hypothetical protein